MQPGEDEREAAGRYHEREHDFGLRVAGLATENATQALKSVLLINGGAAVALLAFIGSILSSEREQLGTDPEGLVAAVSSFAWGASAAVAAMAFAYLTLYSAAMASHWRDRVGKPPYNEETANSRRWIVAGRFFEVIATAAGFGSLVLFGLGVWAVRSAIITEALAQ